MATERNALAASHSSTHCKSMIQNMLILTLKTMETLIEARSLLGQLDLWVDGNHEGDLEGLLAPYLPCHGLSWIWIPSFLLDSLLLANTDVSFM